MNETCDFVGAPCPKYGTPRCMAEIGFFAGLDAGEKARVRAMTRKTVKQRGEIIFREGEMATAAYLVVHGRAKLRKLSSEGKEMILGFLLPDDFFGIEAVFGQEYHTMTAEALEETLVCVCRNDDFAALVQQNPNLALKVIGELGKQWVQLSEQLADMGLRDVRGRVAGTLLRLCNHQDAPVSPYYEFDYHLTHQELAALVGASRVMVTNAVGELREAGCIDMERHRIRRVYPDRLQLFLDDEE